MLIGSESELRKQYSTCPHHDVKLRQALRELQPIGV